MRVALMIRSPRHSALSTEPGCYIDTFYRRVGIATLELLERLNVDVL
jgi:Fe-S oxidoreductase